MKFKKKQPVLRDSKGTLVAASNPRSPISEQYRTIRTNVQFSMVDTELKTLACTSAKPGEGKTTTIANLAVTLAQQDEKVLLIDADLRKPTIHQIMEVSNKNGLTSLITKKSKKKKSTQKETNEITPEDVILKVPNIENLYVLPSGPIPPNPSELLASKMMGDLILELSQEYDWILFDTPPVLAVTDAQILGSRCDGVIFVLRSHQTEKKEIAKAKELLDKTNINLIGTVINDVDQKEANYGYYYGAAND